ncbi:MAG TPA: FG-GAP-like repeat-containing protein [Mycobacteriales bacterium]|nr:FG-GAP-like repeat-containing protein [Mycobacteriales bacterium]
MRRTLVICMTLGVLASVATAEATTAPPRSAAPAARSAGRQISLREPIDFPTGAAPSSVAHNRAAGDQALQLVPKATLSDSVTVGDFDRDGSADVAQTNVVAGTVSILLGDGRGGFAPATQHPVGGQPSFIVSGDLNSDGHLDLAVASFGSGSVAVLLGRGAGGFLPAAFVSAVPSPRSIAIGDFDRDSKPDLAVASSQPGSPPKPPTGGVVILKGTGHGAFARSQIITYTYAGSTSPINANSVGVADFDGDGFDDLAVGVGYSRSAGARQTPTSVPTGDDVLIYLNRGEGTAAVPPPPFGSAPDQPPIRVGASPDAIAVSDFDGDSHPDLAVAGNSSGDVAILLGDDKGHFVVKERNVTVGPLPRSVVTGDLNDDGRADLVTGNWHSSTVSVLEGNGDGTFQPAVEFWSGDSTTSAAVGHFNKDGRLDVVAGRLRDDELALLLNASPQPGDGVVITRDISFGSPTHRGYDPFAEDHTLDVYSPPPRTASFAGAGRPYPVFFWLHGGGGVGGDKSMAGFALRSLARSGIVAVSANYRLGLDSTTADQTKDAAQALRWVHRNIRRYGGDPGNIFVSGHSAGSALGGQLGTDAAWVAEQRKVRGLVLVSLCVSVQPSASQPPSLLVTGDEGFDGARCGPESATFTSDSKALGAESEHVTVTGRDHITVFSDLALAADPGRVAVVRFMRERLAAPVRIRLGAGQSGLADPPALLPAGHPLPATGGTGTAARVATGMAVLALVLRRVLRIDIRSSVTKQAGRALNGVS